MSVRGSFPRAEEGSTIRESPIRLQVLGAAAGIVSHDRNVSYGDPEDNFTRISALWNAYLQLRRKGVSAPIEPWETAIMMILLKVARIMHDPSDADNFVDIAGYAATAREAFVSRSGEDDA